LVRKYQVESELSEKQIEADVAAYFGHISSFFGEFRLLDVNEQTTGADKLLNWRAAAYYFQFKPPVGLKPLTSALKRAKRESRMQDVRRFRRENHLEQHPNSVCFELRKPAPKGGALQHNVLRSYERPPHSRATYVCPLVLGIHEYGRLLQQDREWFPYPFLDASSYLDTGSQWVFHGAYIARSAEVSPFLRGHVCIVPHEDVDTWKHHYSFSQQATDIAFHSPRILAAGPSRLSDFIAGEIRGVPMRTEAMLSPLRLARSLGNIARTWAGDELGEPTENDSVEWLAKHGRLLRDRFGIRQFVALVRPAHQG